MTAIRIRPRHAPGAVQAPARGVGWLPPRAVVALVDMPDGTWRLALSAGGRLVDAVPVDPTSARSLREAHTRLLLVAWERHATAEAQAAAGAWIDQHGEVPPPVGAVRRAR